MASLSRTDMLEQPGVQTLVMAAHFPYGGQTLGPFCLDPANSAAVRKLVNSRKKAVPNLYAKALSQLAELDNLMPGNPPVANTVTANALVPVTKPQADPPTIKKSVPPVTKPWWEEFVPELVVPKVPRWVLMLPLLCLVLLPRLSVALMGY